MTVEIRKAKESEIDQLLDFEKGIVEAERPFDNTLKAGEIHYYDLIALIQSPDAEVLVTEIDGEIVGSGYIKIKPAEPYQTFTEFGYIGFMYVKPLFRGQGINRKILDALIGWAKKRNITEVKLQVYEENTVAKNAYLKSGFKASLVEMRIEVK